MAQPQLRLISEMANSSRVDAAPTGAYGRPKADPRASERRSNAVVVVAVIAFVVSLLGAFTIAAARNAPAFVSDDANLVQMYGP